MALTCPLCDYNLGHKQEQMLAKFEGAAEVPIYYFTQLLAIALGVSVEDCQFTLYQCKPLSICQFPVP